MEIAFTQLWPPTLPWFRLSLSIDTVVARYFRTSVTATFSNPNAELRQSSLTESITKNFLFPARTLEIWNGAQLRCNQGAFLPAELGFTKDHFEACRTDLSTQHSFLANNPALKLLLYTITNNLLDKWESHQVRDIKVWKVIRNSGVMRIVDARMAATFKGPGLATFLIKTFQLALVGLQVDIVTWLLELGVRADTRVSSLDEAGGCLPLVYLIRWVKHGDFDGASARRIIEAILSRGANISQDCCEWHLTPAHEVLLSGDEDLMRIFLNSHCGDNVSQSNQNDTQVLVDDYDDGTESDEYADAPEKFSFPTNRSVQSEWEITKSLVDVLIGTDVTGSEYRKSLTAPGFIISAVMDNNHVLLRILQKLGAQMNFYNEQAGATPLIFAIRSLKYDLTKLLLDLGAAVTYSPAIDIMFESCSPLYLAMERAGVLRYHASYASDAESIFELLLEHGADANEICRVYDGPMSLMTYALCLESIKFAELLCEYRAQIAVDQLALVYKNLQRDQFIYSVSRTRVGMRTNADMLGFVLARNSEVNSRLVSGETALCLAASLGLDADVQILIGAGAIVDRRTLKVAVEKRWWKVAANLYARPSTDYWMSALAVRYLRLCRMLSAIANGSNQEIAQSLAENGAAACREKDKRLMLFTAFQTKRLETLECVMQDITDAYSSTVFCTDDAYWTTMMDHGLLMKNMFQRRNLRSPVPTEEARVLRFAINYAVHFHDSGFMDLLRVEARDWTTLFTLGKSAWHHLFQKTIDKMSTALLRELLLAGLRPNTILGFQVMYAKRFDHLELLLSHGLQVNRRFAWSITMLQFAAQAENIELARRLLKKGANVNSPPAWEIHTPLSYATPIGAMISAISEDSNRDPLQTAVTSGNLELVELFLSAGANVNARIAPDAGATALQISCIKGSIGITNLLISHGADVNAAGAGRNGRTALEGAAEHGRLDTVQLLLENGCKINGPDRIQYIRAVGFARLECHFGLATELEILGDWSEEDEKLLVEQDLTYNEKFGYLDEPNVDEDDVSVKGSSWEESDCEEEEPFYAFSDIEDLSDTDEDAYTGFNTNEEAVGQYHYEPTVSWNSGVAENSGSVLEIPGLIPVVDSENPSLWLIPGVNVSAQPMYTPQIALPVVASEDTLSWVVTNQTSGSWSL